MSFYGDTEFATRFPNIIASAVSILLVYLIAAHLYGSQVALLSALAMALSPFAILYAPTAYADPLLVMWLLLAAVLAQRRRWALAGLGAALAILTKPEALVLLPLVAVLGLPSAGGERKPAHPVHDYLRGLLFFSIVCAVVTVAVEGLWQWLRPGQPSPLGLGLGNYGGIGLVAPQEAVVRLVGWWDEALRWVFVSPQLNLLLAAGTIALVVRLLWGAVRRDPPSSGSHRWPDAILLLALAYLLLARTVISFQLWHRYLLLAVPLLCILLARIVDGLWDAIIRLVRHWPSPQPSPQQGEGGDAAKPTTLALRLVPLLLVAVLMLAPVRAALAGQVPVGSDHGVYWGIEQTALFVREQIPPGSVIYQHSLGWQFSYYIPGVHVDFWWYPSIDWLAATAAGRSEHSQYLILPSTDPSDAIAAALGAYGLELLPVHSALRPDGSVSFQTYRIVPVTGP